MNFQDFFNMVAGVKEYNVFKPNFVDDDDYDFFYPPYFPDEYVGSQIDKVHIKIIDDCWVVAVIYLK